MLFDTGTPRTGGVGRPPADLAADQAGISTSQLGSRRPGDVQHEQLRRQHLHRSHVGGGPVRAFALAYGFALNASRGLATDPLLVRFSGTDIPTWRRAIAKCRGTATTVGLRTGAITIAVAAQLSGTARLAFLALGLAWIIALLVALPRGLGHLLLGNLWRPTYPLVWPSTIYVLGACCGTGAGLGLHALETAWRSLRVVVISSAVSVVLGVAGAAVGGTAWTMGGSAAGSWIGTLIGWRRLRTALRESGGTPSRAAEDVPTRVIPAAVV